MNTAALSAMGHAGKDVVQYSASIPIMTLNIPGDADSRASDAQSFLSGAGYDAIVVAHPKNGFIGAKPYNALLGITLKKNGRPFSPLLAAHAVKTAADNASLTVVGAPTVKVIEYRAARPEGGRIVGKQSFRRTSPLSGFGFLGGDQVTRYAADVSILAPSIFSDSSDRILGLADKFNALGFLASISKINAGYVTTSFHLTLSKNGNAPFSVNDAKAAIAGAATAQSLSLSNVIDVVSEIVVFEAQALPTAYSDKGVQQTSDAFRTAGNKAGTIASAAGQGAGKAAKAGFCAFATEATGLPCWLVGGGVAVLGLAAAIIVIRGSIPLPRFGAVSGYNRRKKRRS